MPRDTGMVTMQSQRRRRQFMLVGVIVVALGLLAYRLAPRGAQANVAADTDQAQRSATSGAFDTFNGRNRVAVTWPVELQRDLFRVDIAKPTLGGMHEDTIRAEAAKLVHPQMILQGRPARVMIDGRILEIGDVFAGFTIHAIENRSIVVEKEAVQVQIDL